ncbi:MULTISPECIES: DUF805 domain-containing protein [Asticcacaulis]|uniref:DUF805 domain-containing protein n=1 Tax=Asticcacaulis TaxID=76890 RepID=UPI001AE21A16|nr:MULTISPECIES: DUF805 domain-containing protein [Asticcacaulis]MBP2158667.1 uncharacterized membrane protein YhaH (DUF805 family) [Asticcacaulis solisilvae]MDR6799713.1 uncharacterized membrane protein YhaH (DUF805 family) [Asticcacaulis sp. BE141]
MSGLLLPLRPLARYADFKGRSGRAEFWAFTLLLWVVYGGLYAWMLTPLVPVFQGQTPGVEIFIHILTSVGVMSLVGLVLFLPALAVQVRRLHDINRSGWWVILPTGLSMAGQQLAYIFQSGDIMRTTMQASQAAEAMAGPSLDFARLWDAYWPLYQVVLPWAFGPSLAGYLVLLIFFLSPGSNGENRFGQNSRLGATT